MGMDVAPLIADLYEHDAQLMPRNFLELRTLQARLVAINQGLYQAPHHPNKALDMLLQLLVCMQTVCHRR